MKHLFQSLIIPDFWQQEAVHALRAGKDVVVHAPTGAGKTYIFELLYPNLRGQAVFTVPTRALANDKLAEWQRAGWDVGIATGDLAYRLDAKVVVATLETQKRRLLEQRGPSLLVIDEYQMIADPVRGVNYELSIALTPPETQLLLLSGSVGNPGDVVRWLNRIGRQSVLVSHAERPVPLEEIHLEGLPDRASNVRGWWPRMMANAVRADLAPILLFAPRRSAAEDLAQQVAGALPPDRPLPLSREQEQLAGPRLGKLLRQRVAYHHSGLSYAQRAGLIEPLAKAGELRAVVATMGLAAGINFSMRSVAVSGTSYLAGPFERQVRPDELLQMFGRAGRRGLDDTGYALVTPQPPRLMDARPQHLRRATQLDWPTLIAVMHAATERGEDPFGAARAVNERLFSAISVPLGCEHALSTGPMPCGLQVDMERARYSRRLHVEMLNFRKEWEVRPALPVAAALSAAYRWEPAAPASPEKAAGETAPVGVGRWIPALASAHILKSITVGSLCRLPGAGAKRFGREVLLGTRRAGNLALAPWLKKLLKKSCLDLAGLESEVLAKIPALTQGGELVQLLPRGDQLAAILTYAGKALPAWSDADGKALLNPPTREAPPRPCRGLGPGSLQPPSPCPQWNWCTQAEISSSPAHAWRLLGLITPAGRPTQRGLIFSFFQHGEGLAIAAGLEDASYPIEEMAYDLANLRGGPRFSGDDSTIGGRLAVICQQAYGRGDFEGYLRMGVPTDYATGASEAIREILVHGLPRQKMVTDSLRLGDIERALLEWRSLLRLLTHAPALDWDRWLALKAAAVRLLESDNTSRLGPFDPSWIGG